MDTAKGGGRPAGLAGRALVVCEREGRRELARERGVRGHFVCDFRERCVPVRESIELFHEDFKRISKKNNQSTNTNDTHPRPKDKRLSLCENIKFYENAAGLFKSWMSLTLEFLTRDSAKPRRQFSIAPSHIRLPSHHLPPAVPHLNPARASQGCAEASSNATATACSLPRSASS